MIRDAADLVALLGVAYTDEQLAAITAPLEPAVIVAGAGSGKTTVMAARVVWLVGTGQVAPERVLGLTFTNKAAGELGQRIRAALERLAGPATPAVAERGPGAGRGSPAQAEAGEPAVATYHSYAGRLIEEHGLRIGVEPHARLLADASRYQLAARVIRRAHGPFRTLTKSVTLLVDDLLSLDAEVSEHRVDLADLRAHDRALPALIARAGGAPSAGALQALAAADRRGELTDLVEAYRAAKRDRDLVDFGDQMRLAAQLAQTCPEVGAAERENYGVVLLDEYQDTSVAQRLMLAGLFAGGHPVTAVGDPCQAIYGWRGASVANLEDFPRHFPRSDGSAAARLSLRENRRNGETILDLANGLAAPLRAIHQGVAPLLASAAARGLGELRASVHETYTDEVEWVAAQVQEALAKGVPADEVAVLVRVTRDIGPLHAALTARDIPVEVVGLGGLVHLPEVADLIALLEVLDDATANAALVRLLVGPRWRIGARDLALLGQRAAELVRAPGAAPSAESALAEAVAGADPVEIASLSDALAFPGEGPFSAEARRRFAALDRELRELRRHVGEPLLDLLHRLATVTGLDVEIAAGPAAVAVRRRESLAAFLDVAASFNDLDGDSSVSAFLAYLRAAEEHERGLDSATPSTAESVKLMTAHKAKGLEWDVVVLPDVTADVFPSNRGRARWTTRGDSLPYPLRGDRDGLPVVRDWTAKGLTAFAEELKELSRLEELRLAYVACTRPRRRLVVSAHWWGPTQKKRRGPSAYLTELREFCRERGIDAGGPWAPAPPDGAVNPCLGEIREVAWPAPLEPAAHTRRLEAVGMVRAAMAALDGQAPPVAQPPAGLSPAGLSPDDLARVAAWDRDLELLLAELRRGREPRRDVELPAALSASQLLVLARDPDVLAADLARPMPRPPVPQARRGTRFHSWVEGLFSQQPLLDPSELPGAADHDLVEAEELEALKKAFLRSPYSERRPFRVEAPFSLAVAGRVIRGRIDAVYETLDGFEVVDWKTNRKATADPLQLAVYRLAWAEIAGVEPASVSAAFLYVRSGKIVRPDPLPGRAELEALLAGAVDGEA